MTYREAVLQASQQATARGFESKRAEWLLTDLFEWSFTDYVMHMNEPIPDDKYALFQSAVQRMLTGEPIQYITGTQSFLGEKFQVDARCLIPRPETEEVFMHFKAHCKHNAVVADIGTGSGILAVMLKQLRPDLEVYATDLYDGPLKIAQQNAKVHHAEVTFLKGNALEPIVERNLRLDGLISNPPYIDFAEAAEMTETVLDFEPHQALFADHQGLAVYIAIIEQLPLVMNEKSLVVFEIGYEQGDVLKSIIEDKYPHINVEVIADINNNDRIVSFYWTSE
ncbi:peptide chain release factor N(5)-glutamine methyltransferase [Staphylococcus debuckii]|uniref:peptide chain release factor N(5)-glutamine methyltransferase n=1 Tax=Staphylococcus debuckii TaxID=2044912 RepID=UPI0019825E10|nr:peptide chain release factor N(5)-glutamine methyltransferase [Staphylococcus debuckii]